MAWKRKPTKQMPVTVNARKGTLRELASFNDRSAPKVHDDWLRKGVLCEATHWFVRPTWGQPVEGIDVVTIYGYNPGSDRDVVIRPGDLCTYLGRMVVGGKYSNHYQFLVPGQGTVIADPSGFKDAREDVNEPKTE